MARHRRSSLYGRGIVNFADNYSLRSHIPLRSCLVGLRLWSDNVNWNSCINKEKNITDQSFFAASRSFTYRVLKYIIFSLIYFISCSKIRLWCAVLSCAIMYHVWAFINDLSYSVSFGLVWCESESRPFHLPNIQPLWNSLTLNYSVLLRRLFTPLVLLTSFWF